MKKRLLLIALVAVLVVAAGSPFAAGATPFGHDFTESPSTEAAAPGDYVIVVFKDPPAASYTGGIPGLNATKPGRGQKLDPAHPDVRAYRSHLANVHANYRAFLAQKAPKAEVVREYFHTLNGVAIRLNGTRQDVLGQGPGVRAVVRSSLYRPTMNVSAGLIEADEVWASLGGRSNAGDGIKVGIIDSGIDDSHPFFACKEEIQHKAYASGVAFYDPENILVSDHGTHVAGTVAGCVTELTEGPITGTISGVAPGASLYDYNVFPGFGAGFVAFGGSAFSHDIIAALEDAVLDGMDVVNLSLGGTVQGPHDLLAEAVDTTVDAGIVAAVAAGNEGPGDSTVSSPGSAPKAITVGASTNPHFIGIRVTVNGENYGAAAGDFHNFDPPVTADYTVTQPANGCSAISTDLTGKIALIDRGACTFTTKVRNAENAGAVGVLVVNNTAGDPVAMGHDGTEPFPTIPAAMISLDVGNAIKPAGTVTVDGTSVTEILSQNADIIAGFSSRGPTPYTYLVKPDLTAPGVNVYSSVFEGEYAMFQGTSMATPHVAGAAALLLDRHPTWSPADVKSALANTAERVVTDHRRGAVDPGVLARGGGRINLANADATPVSIDPVSASFGYWRGSRPVAGSVDLTLRNLSGTTQFLTISVEQAAGVTVTASALEVTLGPGESAVVTLTLDGGQAASGDYTGDVLIEAGSGTTLRVPWWVRIERPR